MAISQDDYTAFKAEKTGSNVEAIIDAFTGLTEDSVVNAGVTETCFDPDLAAIPSDEGAINSAALLVLARDTVTGYATRTVIPARKISAYTSVAGIVQITTGSAADTFKTAYEAHVKSDAGNPVQIVEIKVVGR